MLIMKNRTKLSFSLIFIALILFMMNLSMSNPKIKDNSFSGNELKINLITSPIVINGNGDFSKNATGSGTSNDPYIIDDLIIDGGGSNYCINITNTNAYFKIENCTLENSGLYTLYLKNVSNGLITNNRFSRTITLFDNVLDIEISDNIIEDNSGLGITSSNNVNITKNYIFNSSLYEGIYLSGSSEIRITQNFISNCSKGGIKVQYSNGIKILDNEVYNSSGFIGIYLTNTNNSNINRNYIFNNGNSVNDNLFIDNDTCYNIDSTNNFFEFKGSNGGPIPDLTDWIIFIILLSTFVIGVIIIIAYIINRRALKQKEEYMLPED